MMMFFDDISTTTKNKTEVKLPTKNNTATYKIFHLSSDKQLVVS